MRKITVVANLTAVRISLASALGGTPGLSGDCTAEANADMNLNTAQGRANYAAWQACVPDRAPNAPPAAVPFNGVCAQPDAAGFPGFAHLSDVAAWQAQCNPTLPPVAVQTCPPGYKWDGMNGMGLYDGLGVRALAGLGACVPIAPLLVESVASATAFILNLYHTLFNREPGQLDLDYWVQHVTTGAVTHADVIAAFQGSDEYKSIKAASAAPSSKYTDSQLINGAAVIGYDPATISGAQLTRIQPSIKLGSGMIIVPGSVLAYMLGLGGQEAAGTIATGTDSRQYQMQNGSWKNPPCGSGSTWTDDGVSGLGWYSGLGSCSALQAGSGGGTNSGGSTSQVVASSVSPVVVIGGIAALAFFLFKK